MYSDANDSVLFPSSFVVRLSPQGLVFWFCVPMLWVLGIFMFSSPFGTMFDSIVRGVGIVATFLFWRQGWLLRKPIIVDQNGVWQFRDSRPYRVVIPWQDILSARSVRWTQNEKEAIGVILDISPDSTWPNSVNHATHEIAKHLATFLDTEIPNNPALLTAHYSQYDPEALASFINRYADSEVLRKNLDRVVNI